MDVSQTCRNFIAQASARRWSNAVTTLNGLNMYEMLRCLKALDATDIASFTTALTPVRATVDGPRIDYALGIVQSGRVPPTAPAGLPPDQVTVARHFAARPTSILQEQILKSVLPAFNTGLTACTNAFMTTTFGEPRDDYSGDCQDVTNANLSGRIKRESVGPFTARGLDSAIASLRAVMTTIQTDQRLVYRVLGTQGMLCARYVRGSTTNISNHSWGTAIDLTLGGQLDGRGDNKVQFGLQLIASNFNAAGWYWGAGFPTEDGMHFEAGRDLASGWTVAP
jgi:hypothetical protein